MFSFLTKPVDRDALYKAIDEALELVTTVSDEEWSKDIVTRSPQMLRLLEQAKLVAQSDVSVLINGQAVQVKKSLLKQSTAPAHELKNPLLLLTAVLYLNNY
ncbi:two-component system response regulator (sigma-54 interacting regulator) [Proteus mirabilis]|uniref:Two-component system response regulator (Sigma-54 interacting regulator) n=1 Tax=Proteus mirabilis TaxID=584 RepID=A0A379GFM1_PROMI|nr:two-component system response regulator (sigma-54 interacting regulator) [Proteus mirabilis]